MILIDPWLRVPTNPDKESIAKLGRVDYILVTHGHWDHIGDAVEIGKKTGAVLVAPYGLQYNMKAVLGLGYVLQIDNGPTIYHTGDTDVFNDMKLIAEFFRVDLMLSAIGGHFVMDPSRAALAVEWVSPRRPGRAHDGEKAGR